jgi:5'-nucleotidase/UDP-sugar diphosphatase
VIRIYHTADLHDNGNIAGPLNALRAAHPGLYFDCGDSLRGSQTVYRRSEPIVAELAAAGCNAQAMGNREFHYLFACVRSRAARMGYPLICSNLVDVYGRELPFARTKTLVYEGRRIHLLALLVRQYPVGSFWERVFGWRFLDPIEVVSRYARDVPVEDALVVLSHVGLARDRKIAAAVSRIDLLLGGHSHDTLEQPERVEGVPIVHAGPYGRFASCSELLFDDRSARWLLADSHLIALRGGR